MNLYGTTAADVNIVDQFALENMISDDAVVFGILCYCMTDEKMRQNENIAILNPTYVQHLKSKINRCALDDEDVKKLKCLQIKKVIVVPFCLPSPPHWILAVLVKNDKKCNDVHRHYSMFILDPIASHNHRGSTMHSMFTNFLQFLLGEIYGANTTPVKVCPRSHDQSPSSRGADEQSPVESSHGADEQSAVESSRGSDEKPSIENTPDKRFGGSDEQPPVEDVYTELKVFSKNVIFN